jgi:hypothetical protein
MATKVFVSPGVYTSEKDLSFITRQVGVTTLGLVGETIIGPAFQPIFVSNYGEFQSFFGGTNPAKIKDNGAPKYELPYIAKSYLTQSNQLFVTRVLGFSGYDAGLAWGITLQGALDPITLVTTGINTYTGGTQPLISFTATSAGTIVTLTSAEPIVQSLINNGTLVSGLSVLPFSSTGYSSSFPATYIKTGSNFNGASFNIYLDAKGNDPSGAFITGTTSGVTTLLSGTAYADVENKLVALLRSRGGINSDTQYPAR